MISISNHLLNRGLETDPEDGKPPVDLVRMLQITGTDPAMFDEIAGEYLEQGDETLALMEIALKTSDVSEIQRLAHKLLGSSACCGMVAIVPRLVRLDQMPADVGPEIIGDLLVQASGELENIRRFLTAYSESLHTKP